MLPFLKDRDEGGMSAPAEVIKRSSDGDESFEMLDAIVEDMLEAFNRKDKKLLKGALEALMEHIREEDEYQDQEQLEI